MIRLHCCLVVFFSATFLPAADRPNILFIYTDDQITGETKELYYRISDPDELVNLAWNCNYGKVLKSYRRAAIAELKRTDASFVDKLPPVAKYN